MGVTINKQRSSGDWYIWITHKGKRTSRKVGKDRKYAMKIASEYQKKLLLGEIDFSNGKSPNSEGRHLECREQLQMCNCAIEMQPEKQGDSQANCSQAYMDTPCRIC